MALCIALLCTVAGLFAFFYPWSWVIEKRIASCDPAKLVSDFDVWLERSVVELPEVGSLPASLRMLKPKQVLKCSDGLYLELAGFLAQEAGIFIALPGIDKSKYAGFGHSFRAIGQRVYFYRISG